jgi:hypothetical protein
MAADPNAEKIARDRALAILFSQASSERVLADSVYGGHGGAQGLADPHRRTAELLNILAQSAPRTWANADKLASLRKEVLGDEA